MTDLNTNRKTHMQSPIELAKLQDEAEVKAIAKVTCGYGTDEYDPVTSECFHRAYCSLDKVIRNQPYWDQKFNDDFTINHEVFEEFDLEWGFDSFIITVYNDDTFDVIKVESMYQY